FKSEISYLLVVSPEMESPEVESPEVEPPEVGGWRGWKRGPLRNFLILLKLRVNCCGPYLVLSMKRVKEADCLIVHGSTSQANLVLQHAAVGLSIGLFLVPTEPKVFLSNDGGSGGITNQRISAAYVPNEETIVVIVEMGFTRRRAEETLRNIERNSVEMVMKWLFTHPADHAQEDDKEIAEALALSLGRNVEKAPHVDDILSGITKLVQSNMSPDDERKRSKKSKTQHNKKKKRIQFESSSSDDSEADRRKRSGGSSRHRRHGQSENSDSDRKQRYRHHRSSHHHQHHRSRGPEDQSSEKAITVTEVEPL
ncbi:E3 ubiquitin protein ligase UPL1-like protein, partial [Tanacetum coccineum]